MSLTAMEWGFRAHEKGMNLEMAIREYQKLVEDQPAAEPLWTSPLFTDAERALIHRGVAEEIRDSTNEKAIEYLDEVTERSHPDMICELYMHLDPDTELTVLMLKEWENDQPNIPAAYTGEAMLSSIAFLRRFKLIAPDPTQNHRVEITTLGKHYAAQYS